MQPISKIVIEARSRIFQAQNVAKSFIFKRLRQRWGDSEKGGVLPRRGLVWYYNTLSRIFAHKTHVKIGKKKGGARKPHQSLAECDCKFFRQNLLPFDDRFREPKVGHRVVVFHLCCNLLKIKDLDTFLA